MVSTEDPMPMKTVAAKACYWDFALTLLKSIAKYWGIVLPPAVDLFDCLFIMVTWVEWKQSMGNSNEWAIAMTTRYIFII